MVSRARSTSAGKALLLSPTRKHQGRAVKSEAWSGVHRVVVAQASEDVGLTARMNSNAAVADPGSASRQHMAPPCSRVFDEVHERGGDKEDRRLRCIGCCLSVYHVLSRGTASLPIHQRRQSHSPRHVRPALRARAGNSHTTLSLHLVAVEACGPHLGVNSELIFKLSPQ